jgi:hypothetical protein
MERPRRRSERRCRHCCARWKPREGREMVCQGAEGREEARGVLGVT